MKQVAFLYFVSMWENNDIVKDSPIKIGITKDPNGRLAQLQTGNPSNLFFNHIIPIDPKLAPIVERQIHEILEDHRLEGEWFRPCEELWQLFTWFVVNQFKLVYHKGMEENLWAYREIKKLKAKTLVAGHE